MRSLLAGGLALWLLAAPSSCGSNGSATSQPVPEPPGPPPAPGGPRAWNVTTQGTSDGDGSTSRPLDLATALSANSPARAGDTIWLHGGVYSGAYASHLAGTTDAPIIVRAVPGDRVVLDGNNAQADNQAAVLAVFGSYTWFWGFEITSSRVQRTVRAEASSPAGMTVLASVGIRLINLIVHDMTGNGIGFWAENSSSEIYGTLAYYNGLNDFDHGFYVQNQVGIKRLVDNAIFRNASHGIHAFASSSSHLDDIQLEGNTLFGNGEIGSGPQRNILVGGDTVAHRPSLVSNFTYYSSMNGANNLGYDAGCTDAVVTDNYFAGGDALQLVRCTPTTFARNTIYGVWTPRNLPDLFPDNTYASSLPGGVRVFVRPNRYETGRAHVTIYNWDLRSRVDVGLQDVGLATGDRYEIRDVENYFGPPVATGTYSASSPTVSIPMTGLSTARPVWSGAVVPSHSPPEFGMFVVRKIQ